VIEGQAPPEAGREPNGILYITSPDYLQTLGITLLRGRGFSPHDTPGTTPVALIDEVFARQYFGDQDPLGKRLKQARRDGKPRNHRDRQARRTLKPGRTECV
jgi:hypothetical protein